MPQYLSPGVYVEEVPGTPPIAGVGTSTAGFIGVVADDVTMPDKPGEFIDIIDATTGNPIPDPTRPGRFLQEPVKYTLVPLAEPCLVTDWTQFKKKFGEFQAGNKDLAHGVYGFFHNGGTRCWVARLESAGDMSTAENSALTKALKKFEAIDEIAIVAIPGETDPAVQNAVIDHCESMKDRFAILDGHPTTEITAETIGGARPSKYAALYFPWIEVANPLYVPGSQDEDKKDRVMVAPSGYMAGIYARVDQERGVHKAPANEIVRGALGLEYPVSKNEQEGLNPKGINVIRAFNGNILVWGARTLGDDNGEYKYINVRRLMNFIAESIDEGTRFVVFEPNNPALWQRIIRTVRAFLMNVWRDGALFGNTPEEAFYVKCDAETNPPEVRELGQVITEIGVAIVKPAEFVIFRISQLSLPAA